MPNAQMPGVNDEQLKLQIAALASTASAIIITDPEGNIIWVNSAFAQLTGYSVDEVIGENPRILKSGWQRPDFYRRLWETILAGEVWRGQVINRRKDGRLYTEEMVITPVKDAEGATTFFVAIKQDISERIAAENALRESETRYRQVVENSPILISTWQDLTLVFINSVGARLMGFNSPEEIVGKNLPELVHPSTVLELTDFFIHQTADFDQAPNFYEISAKRLDGTRFDLAISFLVMNRDGGQLVQVIGLDITERKRVQQSLARQAALAEVELAINQPLGLNEVAEQIVRLAVRTLEVSGGAGISLLDPPSETYISYIFDPSCSEEIRTVRGSLLELQNAAQIFQQKETLILPDITPDSAELAILPPLNGPRSLVALPLLVKDEVLGLIFIYERQSHAYESQDIDFLTAIANRSALAIAKVQLFQSLQQAKDTAENAAREKVRMLAKMSHELRTPLTTIISLAELLGDTELSKNQKDYVGTINASASRLLKILNDVIDFSRMGGDKLLLNNQPFDLSAVIDEAIEHIAMNAFRKNLDLDYEIAPDVPRVLYGDSTRLGQVLTNLLSNAVKFTEVGGIQVEVRLGTADPLDAERKLAQTKRTLVFSISDTGIGIQPEESIQLFGTFSQISPQSHTSGRGAGSGLAICKQLVDLMDGRIWVESPGVAGKGSTFSFTVQMETEDQIVPEYYSPDLLPFLGRRALVLIPKQQQLVKACNMLAYWGMDVEAFNHMVDALPWLGSQPALEIVLVDGSLFTQEEPTILAQMHKILVSDYNAPLILLTYGTQNISSPIAQSASRVIHYPISMPRLYDAIQSAFPSPQTGLLTEDEILSQLNRIQGEKSAVLLVEDDPVNLKILQIMIETMGFEVETATDGRLGLLALEKRVFDIVLLDMHMPNMNGLDTTRAIRQQFEAERQPFIVILTADTQIQTQEALHAAGSDAFLAKPFTRQTLLDVIEKGIDTRRRWNPQLENRTVLAVPPVDDRTIQDLIQTLGNDHQEITQFFTLFFESTPQLMEKIRAAAAANDHADLRGHLHALRGSGELLGAYRLNQLCKDTKSLLETGDIDSILAKVAEVEAEYNRVIAALHVIAEGQSRVNQ